MTAVTVIVFSQAFLYESLAVSFLGRAGGSLTPFLLSTGHANQLGLFTYIFFLDVGLLAVVFRRSQRYILHPLSFAGTCALSIVVFGVTILKIFFYDLSYFETLYRIFSFVGLGVILLTVSYLCQKNKDIILETTGADEPRLP